MDPLSIAASVVGITAAGMQAAVKLWALAEKVATASEKVKSVGNDISITCAVLRQMGELIKPRYDAQGTLRSVFNYGALNDIWHALRRCESFFTEIQTLLSRAFAKVGNRPVLQSKVKLSWVEKTKWPFLQPQFDELRNDLRGTKVDLVLMIGVANLALAQRDWQQRPIDEAERLELTSTVLQLRRARPLSPDDIDLGNVMRPRPTQNISTSGAPQSGRNVSANEHPSTSQSVVLSVSRHPRPLSRRPSRLPPPPPVGPHRPSPSYYTGWTANHLHGLITGYGDALSLDRMELPDHSLERLVKAYADAGHDVHIAMSELTREQQALIKRTCSENHGLEVVYVRLKRDSTVSSVFGMLNIETLKWIIASDKPSLLSRGTLPPILTASHLSARHTPYQRSHFHQSQGLSRFDDQDFDSIEESSSECSHDLEPESNFDDPRARRAESMPAPHSLQMRLNGADSSHSERASLRPTKGRRPEIHCIPPTSSGPPLQFRYVTSADEFRNSSFQPAEESEEDIVNELLARWTTL